MRRLVLGAVLLAFGGVLMHPADAFARNKVREHHEQRKERISERRNAAAAARLAQERNGGGRVLSVDDQGDGGYKVKLLKDGEVRTYTIRVD